jgi:hypothetical protein
MTETAIVLFVKRTGHVLASVTRTSDPAAAPAAADLAGEQFPVRDEDTGDVLVEIPAEELDSKGVPFEEDLLLTPQLCLVTNDSAQRVPAGSAPTVDFSGTGVKITLPSPATAETPVWAQVDSGTGQGRRHEVLPGKIAAGATAVELGKNFPSGETYDVLALARGLEPVVMPGESP